MFSIKHLCSGFIARGADLELPVAVIDKGTRADQKVVIATVSTLCDKLRGENLEGPAMIVIGTVVTLREKLAWYKTRAGAMRAGYDANEAREWLPGGR